MRSRLLGVIFAFALVLGVNASAASAPTFTFPVRIGFRGRRRLGARDCNRSIRARLRSRSHYTGLGGRELRRAGSEVCPTCASPHSVLQISNDGGQTWGNPHALAPALTRQDDPQIVVDPADGRTVYAAYMQDNKSSEYVARSDDFGQTWRTMLTEPLQRGTDKDILAARAGHVYLVYHTQQKIFASVSHDGGRTWSTHNLVGTTNSEFGVSYASGGAVDSKGNAYFAWNGVNNPGQAKGTINLYVDEVDRRRHHVDDASRGRLGGTATLRLSWVCRPVGPDGACRRRTRSGLC